MKILIINQHKQNALGGSEIQCDLIAKHLKKLGNDVTYVAINGKSQNYNTNYKVYPIENISIKKLIKVINIKKPNIIYWRYNKRFLLKASIISRLKGVKFVFSLSSNADVTKWVFPQIKRDNNFIKQKIQKIKVLRRALIGRINYLGFYFTDAVVTLNKDFLKYLPKSVEHKAYIKNSMELKLNDVFNWDKPYVVWVANIKKHKNPEVFIELSKKFKDYPIDFLMIGKIQDDYYNYILDKENIPNNLYYLGAKDPYEVNSILKESLFLVHTCNPEGFGNNFIQAWLQSKPTISLYFDPGNIIENKKLGFYSRNTQQLYRDVNYYLSHKSVREADGVRARNFAIKEFSPQSNIKQLQDFLLTLLRKR